MKKFKDYINKGGVIKCFWDGNVTSENAIKAETKATIRCIINEVIGNNHKCVYTGKQAKYEVIFARAY